MIRSFIDVVRANSANPHSLAQDIAVFAKDYVTKHMVGGFSHHLLVKELMALGKLKKAE